MKQSEDRARQRRSAPCPPTLASIISTDTVHHHLKEQIEEAAYPNLRAERSFAKQAAEPTPENYVRYGYPRSVRVDAYEIREDGTLCIYDFKTGRGGITEHRWQDLANAPLQALRNVTRIIVIEVRPSP